MLHLSGRPFIITFFFDFALGATIGNWGYIWLDYYSPLFPLCPPVFRMSLVLTHQNATVAEFQQLVHGRLKPCDLALVSLDGSEVLCEESSEE
jgi:hypothetical protein